MTSQNTGKRAALYMRISKDKAGAGVGVADQERQCREVAARLGLDVTAVHADNDISAFKKGQRSKPRPGYLQLLDDLRSRRVDAVIAWHTDRLHRDLPELEGYIDACGEGRGGVPTYTVQGGDLDLSTSSGRMVARILGAVARQEVEHMIERQEAGKRRNRGAGIRSGSNAPFGYRLDERDADGRQIPGVSKGLAVIESEAAAVRRAYASVLAGVSLNAIARELNAAGFRTHKQARGRAGMGNGTWKQVTARHMLLRAANAALIEYPASPPGRGEIVGKAAWEPIVDEDTYRAVRRILTDPARRTSPGRKPAYLLTGVLICGVCGGRYFVAWAGKPGNRFYVCGSRQKFPGAPGSGSHVARRIALVDEYVEEVIIEKLGDPAVVAALNTRPSVDIPALDARRTAINAELEEWARTPGITPRQLQIKNGPLIDDLADVERQISEGLRGDPLPEFAGNDPVKVWAGLKEAGDIERMRAIAKLLLRVRLLPAGKSGRKMPPGSGRGKRPFNYDAVQILPPDA